MNKKKNSSKLDILTLYMDLVSEQKIKPLDVEDFCEQVD
ncbi:MAG: hypothetical protein ACJA1B_002796, partial [Polaribacter sp.]